MSDKGAHFFRCDLQVHSPRDLNWAGDDCVTDEERTAYADKLVEACRAKGLQGIAISDHHDLMFAEYVRQAALREKDSEGNEVLVENRLVVFPAMELTLGVPCQALLIFDADFPADLFALAMTALTLTPSASGVAKTAATTRLHHIQSLLKLKEDLDKFTYLRDRYIVFPNIGENGQFSLLRAGQAGKYVEMPCVGGYLDGDISRLGQGNRNIIAGKAKEWGHKRIAFFQTSDNRSAGHEVLGVSSTWIKWATPTAEALRQACLAQESRVSQTEPLLPSVSIASISVSNSVFLGPIELEINPQYSALIGGRGTGKSTILEYLRWALCDQPPGSDEDEGPSYQARRSRLIEQTLKPVAATVQVRFELNSVPHIVRRNSQDGSLLIKIGTDDMRACTEDEVRTLLPIQAYSQKQLSDVSVRVEELSRFITAPIRATLSDLERQANDRAGRIRQNYAVRSRHRGLSLTIQNRELQERSLTGQADTLRSSLTGLSTDDRALLERGKDFNVADRAVSGWLEGIRTIEAEVASLRSTIDSFIDQIDVVPESPEPGILQAARDEYRQLLTDAKISLNALLSRAESMTAPVGSLVVDSPWRLWSERLEAFKTSYDAAVQRSSAHSEKMNQLSTVEEQLGKHGRETTRVREAQRSLAAADATYQTERDTWESLLKKRDELMDVQCKGLTKSSGGSIRAQVKRFADAGDFVAGLRQSLSGSRVQGNKIEALGESITSASDPDAQWHALLDDLEKLAEFDAEQDSAESRPNTAALSAASFTAGDLDRVAHSLKPEAWLALSLTPIKSLPIFEYRSRESEYIPFRNASAGQQATALLMTLLNESGPPLIIDQPEEDLDNPVMLEIVQQVWQAKQKRQIIFASHNANLVVNGDAELVAWCDYRTTSDQSRGTIAGQGAIDIPDVREAIKGIMEGGEAAFNLRKEKYGF